ncbi:MAG: helix-turn-helix transcriptional regulator [Saprospiraceae bacterium]|nr:helix-turn-helix transcriptional regulator [Saprospiraceae bacterium]
MTLLLLSDTLKISKSAISDYEIGKTLPGLDVVQKFSAYFEVPIDDLYNSDITEFYNNGGDKIKKRKALGVTDDISIEFENEKYIFNIRLLTQKLESIQLQIHMLKQLIDSREAENKTLKINIKLLEEQLKNFH